jgi:hypothetical protein
MAVGATQNVDNLLLLVFRDEAYENARLLRNELQDLR